MCGTLWKAPSAPHRQTPENGSRRRLISVEALLYYSFHGSGQEILRYTVALRSNRLPASQLPIQPSRSSDTTYTLCAVEHQRKARMPLILCTARQLAESQAQV